MTTSPITTSAPLDPHQAEFKRNFAISILDGSFFGLALGIASFVTLVPLFVDSLTDSAILIGLISATHTVGWQLPQLLTAGTVGRLARYKPLMLLMSLNERIPFLIMALVAWQSEALGNTLTLILSFILLTWRGLGGGFTATAWQSLIGKIIPTHRQALFFTTQSAGANLLASLGALIAGAVLHRFASPLDFAICFLLAFVFISVSWGVLAQIREYPHQPSNSKQTPLKLQAQLGHILRTDRLFRWYIAGRICMQIGWMSASFLTVYAVNEYDVSDTHIGIMTALLMVTQTAVGPLLGWLGDRWSLREMMALSGALMSILAIISMLATSSAWFYGVFILAGMANIGVWSIALALNLRFGNTSSRPAYIGLTNTLIAPATLLAPLIGGLVVDTFGYHAMFAIAALGGIATTIIFHLVMSDPHHQADERT